MFTQFVQDKIPVVYNAGFDNSNDSLFNTIQAFEYIFGSALALLAVILLLTFFVTVKQHEAINHIYKKPRRKR